MSPYPVADNKLEFDGTNIKEDGYKILLPCRERIQIVRGELRVDFCNLSRGISNSFDQSPSISSSICSGKSCFEGDIVTR